ETFDLDTLSDRVMLPCLPVAATACTSSAIRFEASRWVLPRRREFRTSANGRVCRWSSGGAVWSVTLFLLLVLVVRCRRGSTASAGGLDESRGGEPHVAQHGGADLFVAGGLQHAPQRCGARVGAV